MRKPAILIALSFALAPVTAFADGPTEGVEAETPKATPTAETPRATTPVARPAAKKRVVRRAERLSAAKSEASRKSRVEVVEPIDVIGRRQLPMAITDISRVEPEFSVGTARYSERDRRFLKNKEVPRPAPEKTTER
jgi:hypothetical protein